VSAGDLPPPSFSTFAGKLVRIVESQEHVATTLIVDNLAEQHLLETMLDESKPGAAAGDLHYLLATPFRYPPLRHGSRFGTRYEPSLFYASLDSGTCLQECAYYRFLFWHDMAVPPPAPVASQHTLFRVRVRTGACVDLRTPPFDHHREQLRSPTSYAYTHRVGTHCRGLESEALLFESARGSGVNAALFTPAIFAGEPFDQGQLNSQLSAERVYFRGREGVFQYSLAQFADAAGLLLRVPA
jgi:hypothetical protein